MLDRSEIPDGSGAKQRGRPQPFVQVRSLCDQQSAQQTVCIHLAPTSRRQSSHRRAAATLLDWSEIPDGSDAKQRGRLHSFVGKHLMSAPQTVCIHLALKSRRQSSHRRAAATLLDWSEIVDGSRAKQRGRRQPFVGKHLVRVLARQANSVHPPRTKVHALGLAPKSSRNLARSVGDP